MRIDGEISTIPMEDHVTDMFKEYSPRVSHGFIMEFRYSLEAQMPEEGWARSYSCMVDGELTVPERPIDECIATVYHIFTNLEMSVGLLPSNIAYILGHVYNILMDNFDDEITTFMVDCDSWNCYGYPIET